MENPKIINTDFNPIYKKSNFITSVQEDYSLVKTYAMKIIEIYSSLFPDVKVKEFIDDTYSDIKQWNLEERLNGSVGFSGPLRYAFLAGIFPKFAEEFSNRQLIFVLDKNPYHSDEFSPIFIHPKKEMTILPYLMDTNPYQIGYSGYLKKDRRIMNEK